MGFAGRNFENHEPLWLQTVRRWEREDPERFARWQAVARELVTGGTERREAAKEAWRKVGGNDR